jgi:hypothetical protein
MKFTKILIPPSVLAMLVFAATPARADHRGGGHSRGSNAARSTPRSAAPRMASPRSQGAQRYGGSPRAAAVAPRSAVGPRTAIATSRGAYPGRVASRAVGVGPRFVGAAPYRFAPYRFSRPYYAFRPRLSLGIGLWAGFPIAYPYYGGYSYPHAYAYPYQDPNAYSYTDPYAYPSTAYPAPSYGYAAPNPSSSYSPSAYPPSSYPSSGYPPAGYPSSGYPPASYPPSGYPPASYPPSNYPTSSYPQSGYPPPAPGSGSVGVQRGTASSGGVSFEISPATAVVYVDGMNVGTVGDFGPTSQPLALAPGRHRIEVRASGYQTIVVDADVKPGEVTPYQGTMQPLQP